MRRSGKLIFYALTASLAIFLAVASPARIALNAEHDVDLFVFSEYADRHAAACAPDGALMMRTTGRPHDFTEITPGIDDFSGYRHALRFCRLRLGRRHR